MAQYHVIVSNIVAGQLLGYVQFIANVSPSAAKRFVDEYESILDRLEDNPFQFQVDTSFNNPDEYRSALFARWFKCLFIVDGSKVYLDAVIDCRQDTSTWGI
jgi:hypothetical protein